MHRLYRYATSDGHRDFRSQAHWALGAMPRRRTPTFVSQVGSWVGRRHTTMSRHLDLATPCGASADAHVTPPTRLRLAWGRTPDSASPDTHATAPHPPSVWGRVCGTPPLCSRCLGGQNLNRYRPRFGKGDGKLSFDAPSLPTKLHTSRDGDERCTPI